MEKLITLVEFYNYIGRNVYSNWSDETINYLYDVPSRKTYIHFKKRALYIRSKALKVIKDSEGILKVCFGQGQGYIDPPFKVWDVNFPRSICGEISGDYYPCKVLLKTETRGRKKLSNSEEAVNEFIQTELDANRIQLDEITKKQTVLSVEKYLRDLGIQEGTSDATIRRRLRDIQYKLLAIKKVSK